MEQMVGVSFVQVLDDGEFAVGGLQAVGLSGPRAGYRRAHDLRSHNPAAFGGPGSASFADGGTVGGNAGVRAVRFPAPAAACRADRRQSGFAVEVLKVSGQVRVQQRHPHLLALRMRRLKWFFRTFPRFQKSAESGRQCGDHLAGGVSTLGSHQMARAGVAAHSSSWTPAASGLEVSSL